MSKEKNPIEKAIGKRTENPPQMKLSPNKLKKITGKIAGDIKQAVLARGEPTIHSEEEPTAEELVELEKLQQQTTELVGDEYPDSPMTPEAREKPKTVPAPKPESQSVTTPSSPESLEPPQGDPIVAVLHNHDGTTKGITNKELDRPAEEEFHPVGKPITNIEKLPSDFKVKHTYETGVAGVAPTPAGEEQEAFNTENQRRSYQLCHEQSAEDVNLIDIRDYILSNGFNVAMVSMHLSILCAQPSVIPSTTAWAMPHWERVPEMVYKTLTTPGFIENIYPALKIVMGSNIGNKAGSS